MKYIKEFTIIFLILQIGNLISNAISSILIIPGSIIGMLILFLLLINKIVKITMIENIAHILLKNMSFFFIPLGVSLLVSFEQIKNIWLELLIILVISNIIVMVLSGKVVDFLIDKERK